MGCNATSSAYGVQECYRLLSCLATDNAAYITPPGARRLYFVDAYNVAASVRYLKLYDKASTPTAADTPKMTIALPPASSLVRSFDEVGVTFFQGIGIRITEGVTDTDTTLPTAGDVLALNLNFQ